MGTVHSQSNVPIAKQRQLEFFRINPATLLIPQPQAKAFRTTKSLDPSDFPHCWSMPQLHLPIYPPSSHQTSNTASQCPPRKTSPWS
mmetsp:Transcript_4800/g.12073  ORF Transcript_4800/g.12073 Transcript_4800/m.12073 type:complete len:87 (+) Transcript_4800:1537-1797(+)